MHCADIFKLQYYDIRKKCVGELCYDLKDVETLLNLQNVKSAVDVIDVVVVNIFIFYDVVIINIVAIFFFFSSGGRIGGDGEGNRRLWPYPFGSFSFGNVGVIFGAPKREFFWCFHVGSF